MLTKLISWKVKKAQSRDNGKCVTIFYKTGGNEYQETLSENESEVLFGLSK